MSGDTWEHYWRFSFFRLRGCHPLRLAFPCHSSRNELCNSMDSCGESCRSRDTCTTTAATLTLRRFRLIPVRSPLLGKSSFLYFPAGTEMFQFSAFPPFSRLQEMNLGRFPDLGDLRIIACLAAPRSLSQLCYVLRRLWTPRHPPCTLQNLTFLFSIVMPRLIRFTLFSKISLDQ